MKKLLAITAWAVMARSAALAATMASQPWVTNRIAEAEARVGARISAATNAIPAPDYSTGNAQLVATIEATAPAPGNYAAVSNRAMTALQSHQSLAPSTNYTDAALGAFASTGAVARAATYGTPTRWTDATGCVWEVGQVIGPWSFSGDGMEFGATYSVEIDGESQTFTYFLRKNDSLLAVTSGEDDVPMSIRFVGTDYDAPEPMAYDIVASRSYQSASNLVGRVALTNDIPDVSGYATPADVTAAIREHSLGGIWDQELEVWWTPKMRNGALTYEATTNVNLNAGN